ncbi:MAG: hypothetical protein PHG79_13630, partial [Methanosarcina sp.]|nr:hypothetical protein [Methanosarcina sp.]
SNRKTYILVRNCREGSLFCDVHLITITQNKEHLFLSYCQSQDRCENKIGFGMGPLSIIVGQPLKDGVFVTLRAPDVIKLALTKLRLFS